jgi:peptidoglycan/LPS O-acetylase OafA/YrhL
LQDGLPQAGRDNKCEDNFTVLRFVLAVLVILSHASERGEGGIDPLARLFHTISIGELAVDAFFVLSGFLVTASWERSPVPSKFLRKRILRIYPGFIVSFIISVLIIGPIGARDVQSYIGQLHPGQLVISAASLQMPDTPPTFLGSPNPVVNKAIWTIHLEFACYLLLLGLGFARVLERKWAIILLWASALVAFVTFRYISAHTGGTGAIYGGFGISLLRFTPLCLTGAVIYKTQLHRHHSAWLIIGATALLLLGLCNKITAEAAVGTAGAYLMIILGSTSLMPYMVKKIPDISYGVYLYGWPAEKLVSMTRLGSSALSVFACSLLFAILMGLLSWYIIERPALKLKKSKAERLAEPATDLRRSRLKAPGAAPAEH